VRCRRALRGPLRGEKIRKSAAVKKAVKEALIECDSDPFFCAPYHTAGESRTVCHEYELVRNAN